jgi:hypothetical protein
LTIGVPRWRFVLVLVLELIAFPVGMRSRLWWGEAPEIPIATAELVVFDHTDDVVVH